MRWLELDSCSVDLETGDVVTRARPGTPIRLTSRELLLLRSLAAHPGEVLGRDVLLGEVFGYASNTVSRAVDKAMDSLRAKVERDKSAPAHLVTVHGQGYRFVASAARPRPQGRGDGFVGRDAESAALRACVGADGFVTVLGPGGVGKTRLVTEVFASEQPALALCDLSGCRTLADLLGEAERALAISPGARDQGARLARITEVARTGQHRLVLDSAEHAAQAVRTLADAMAGFDGVVIVATSRVRLDLPGERVVTVGGLDREAGRALFLGRAPSGDTGGAQLDGDLDDIDAIVELVDGIPLAIELAARRTGLLPARELRRRLGHTLDLLSGAPVGAPERQRDVARTVAWSWDLLSPPERDALVQLTVFEGGFELDAAEAIVAPQGEVPVFELVQALLDASLVRRGPDGRLALYEVVRQFARERLPDAQRRALGERHGRWFAGLGNALGVAVRYGVEPLDQLERELGNLRAVYAHDSGASVDQRVDARLAVHAWMRIRGAYPEREALLDAAVAESHGLRTEARVMALNARALLDVYRGIPTAPGAFDEAYALAAELGDPKLTVRTQLCDALAMRMTRRTDDARLLLARAREVPLDEPWITANLAHEALSIEVDANAADNALAEQYARMVDDVRDSGFSWLEAIGRANLGRIHMNLDHPTEARRQHLRALELGLALRSAHIQQLAELGLAHVALELDDWPDVVHRGRRAIALANVEGDRDAAAQCHLALALAAACGGDPGADARAEAHAADGIATRSLTQPSAAMLHLVRAYALSRLGRPTEARDALARAEPGNNGLVTACRRLTEAILELRAADAGRRAALSAQLEALIEGPHRRWSRLFAGFAARELGEARTRRIRVVD